MILSRKRISLIVSLALLAGLFAAIAPRPGHQPDLDVIRHQTQRPVAPPESDVPPPEVRQFLSRVLEKLPEGGAGVTGYQFFHWEQPGKPTHEAVGIKAIPLQDPDRLIARVMDVDHYVGRIAHVDACRSEPDLDFPPPGKVRCYQGIRVPGVAKVQQVLVLVDAKTIKGYRVAYWYLLENRTDALNPKAGARSDFNVGAWFAAPGVVGYAMSCWPRRDDVNALQWVSLTRGADALAKRMVAGNIDGMAAWAGEQAETPGGKRRD